MPGRPFPSHGFRTGKKNPATDGTRIKHGFILNITKPSARFQRDIKNSRTPTRHVFSARRETIFPLLGREGRGEGEQKHQSISTIWAALIIPPAKEFTPHSFGITAPFVPFVCFCRFFDPCSIRGQVEPELWGCQNGFSLSDLPDKPLLQPFPQWLVVEPQVPVRQCQTSKEYE